MRMCIPRVGTGATCNTRNTSLSVAVFIYIRMGFKRNATRDIVVDWVMGYMRHHKQHLSWINREYITQEEGTRKASLCNSWFRLGC